MRRRLLAAMPGAALLLFALTVWTCLRLATGDWSLHDDIPEISMLGVRSPERWVLSIGFTMVASMLIVVVFARARSLQRDPLVARSWGLRLGRLASLGLAVLALIAFLVMSWVPMTGGYVMRTQDAVHGIAALCTFGLVFLHSVVHAITCVVLWWRARPHPHRPGPLATALILGAANIQLTAVLAWVFTFSTPAQYVAAFACFAQFVPFSPSLLASGPGEPLP